MTRELKSSEQVSESRLLLGDLRPSLPSSLFLIFHSRHTITNGTADIWQPLEITECTQIDQSLPREPVSALEVASSHACEKFAAFTHQERIFDGLSGAQHLRGKIWRKAKENFKAGGAYQWVMLDFKWNNFHMLLFQCREAFRWKRLNNY